MNARRGSRDVPEAGRSWSGAERAEHDCISLKEKKEAIGT